MRRLDVEKVILDNQQLFQHLIKEKQKRLIRPQINQKQI